jgi:hypothetical protein
MPSTERDAMMALAAPKAIVSDAQGALAAIERHRPTLLNVVPTDAGIALAFLAAGFAVTIVELSEAASRSVIG